MKITVMLHTASPDNFLSHQGIESAIQMYVDCLEAQTFKDFEFVFVDSFYETNKEKVEQIDTTFQLKHVPIHKDHRYWYDQNLVYISSAKNTGILYTDGELIVSFDDAELFPETLLQAYWNYYQSGLFMHALHKRLKSVNTENGRVKIPIGGEVYVNDSRYSKNFIETKHQMGNWLYAGTSYSLEAALRLNGFNEKMDGCKSLEDCEFGTRMAIAGYRFVCHKEKCLFILDHVNASRKPSFDGQPSEELNPGSDQVKTIVVKENYGFIKAAIKRRNFRANTERIPQNDLRVIEEATRHYQNFSINYNKPEVKAWLDTPNFDLRKQREKLRDSSEWRW